jgi:hypothetical protein
MLLICGGIVGSLVGGYILDKTKAYKYVEIFVKKVSTFNSFFFNSKNRKVTFAVYVLSFLSLVLFTSTIHLHEYVAFVTMIIVG